MQTRQEPRLLHKDLVYQIQGAVYEVYRHLGAGFLEKVYERALVRELPLRGLKAEVQTPIQVRYKGDLVGEYVADLLVEGCIILELKA